MAINEYTRPCGCLVRWDRQAPNCATYLAQTCPEHEVVIVLRKKGDKGTLGPREEGT